MGLINRTAAALLATTALCGVAYAQSQPTITPGTVIQPGFVEGLFGGKVDVNNGTAANLTSTGGTFASPTLTGVPTAPTPASTSGATQIATKGYVDNAAGSNGGVAQQCTIANVGGLEAMSFAAKAELSCYNLTLTQANPTLTISGGLTGAYQRTTVIVKEPTTNSYAWTLPTSTSGNVVVLGNVVPLIAAGAITQFTATTYDGGNNIYITGGSGTESAPTTTSATALTLDTPAQARPNTSITLTGTYMGTPQSLDYNFGNGWIQAQNPVFSNGVFSVVVSSGEAAGTYAPQIRDHYTTSVTATAGQFIASAWTPGTLSTSPGAAAVFEFNANNPALAPTTTGATVAAVVNSLNTSQSLQSIMGATGNPVLIAHNQGSDSHHRLLQFHATTIGAGTTDPAANWLGAGGASGTAGSALVNLANSTNASANGSFTTVVAMNIDKTYIYEAGPIWGAPLTPGPTQYAQIRANMSSNVMGASYHDATGAQTNTQSSVTAGWHVLTMIKNGAVLTYRMDGQQVASSVDSSTGTFTATDFMLGGGFPTDGTAENGAPPPYVGEFQAYSGALAGSDLANAEMLAGNSIGLTLNPTVPTTVTVASSLAVSAPSNVVTGTQFSVAGTYTGGPPTALDVSIDGSAYTAVISPTISGGTYSFTEAALTSTGTHTVSVRDHNAPTVISTAASFTVSSPAATGVTALAFDAAPTNCVAYQACTFTGTYTGSNATSLDYQLDALGWGVPTINAYANGQFSITMPAGNSAGAGAHTLQVRDHVNTGVIAQVSFTEAAPATAASAATALTVDTPAQTRPGTTFTITGTYSGGQTTALDWSSDGSTWTAASNPTISTGSSGTYSFAVSAGIATVGTYRIYVRDDNAQTVKANSGNFVVNAFTPSALGSSPNASYVWGFDANNQSSVPAAADGSVSQVFNNLSGSSSQYLAAKQGSNAVKVVAVRLSGSDGAHRVIQFAPSTTGAPTAADPAANWLSAGGTSGTAGAALVNLANSTNLSNNGAFTAIEAVQVDTSKPYETMMAWGQPPSPGPYNVARIRWKKTDNALGVQVYGSSTSSASIGGTGSTAWMVVTIVKDASGNVTYRQNGTVVGTSTMNLTNTFTSSDFMLGGDFAGTAWSTPTGEGGLPPPYIAAFQAYSGTLSTTDLSSAEHMVGSAIGVTW